MDTHNWSGFSLLDIYLFLSFQAETATVLGLFNFVLTIPRTHVQKKLAMNILSSTENVNQVWTLKTLY